MENQRLFFKPLNLWGWPRMSLGTGVPPHDELEYRVGGGSEGRPRDRQDDIGGPEVEEWAGPISQRDPGQVSAGGE